MMGMLVDIGIEKRKPFAPTADPKRAMLEGIKLAYASIPSYFTTEGKSVLPWWEDIKSYIWNFASGQGESENQ